MYCGDECGRESGRKKEQSEAGLAVKSTITRAVRPPEFINDRLLRVTLELRGRAKTGVRFIMAYAPTETQNASNKHAFWTTVDIALEEVPKTRTVVRADGCQRPHGEEGEGSGGE